MVERSRARERQRGKESRLLGLEVSASLLLALVDIGTDGSCFEFGLMPRKEKEVGKF